METKKKIRRGNPKVSVVMPTWNRAYSIAQAIRSICDQTFKSWELIVVDDGSTDDTESVVKSFNDPRIKYFKTEHSGIPTSRNYGYSKAKGEWILDMDSDDVSLPDRIEKLLPFTKNYDVIYAGIYMTTYDNKHKVLGRIYLPANPLNIDKLKKSQNITGPTLVKKSVWKHRPFRKEAGSADDWMKYLDWALSRYRFKAVNIGLYEYIRNWDSATIQTVKDGTQKELFKIIKQITKNEYT